MNKILIVEDEFSISNFMKTVLEGDGYTVEVATCAAQARAALEKMEFSAMLLDLGLPDADGLELLRELRQDHVIIFSTHILQLATDLCDEIAVLSDGRLRQVDSQTLKSGDFEAEIIGMLKDEEHHD